MEIQLLINKQTFSKDVADEIDNNIVGFNIDDTSDGIAIAVKSKDVYAFYTWDYIQSCGLTPHAIARSFLDYYYNRDTR